MLIATGLLGLYILPFILLGEDAYVTIHDNLDSDFLYLHLLKITRTAFDFDLNTVIPNVMSGGPFKGIPRAALRSGLNLEVLSFWLMPPYVAQVVNFSVIHSVGLMGMYVLLKRYVLPEPDWAFVRVSIAFLFALIPFYTVHGVSVSGQPLLLFAFLNLLTYQARWTDWLIISLFPFYSFFVWAGLFICVALGVIGIGHGVWALERKGFGRFNWTYFGGLVLLSSLYVVCEWQMIYSFLARTYVSHRTEYDYARLMPITVAESLRKSYHLFVQSQYHAGAFITVWIVLVATLSGLLAYFRRNTKHFWQLAALLISIGIICLINGFYRFPAVWMSKGSLLQSFQFDRFYFLLPLLWLLLLAVALREFGPRSYLNGLFLGVQLVVILAANKEFIANVRKLTGSPQNEKFPSYQAFYSPHLFGQIRDYIGQPQSAYRVISIGMHPAVAIYNGFYTLDGYQNNYLLAYKHAFRQIIAPELAKGRAEMRTYYDAYACRVYLYTAELGMNYMFGKTQNRSLNHLQINTKALAALNGQYVISAVPIRNATENQLHLEKVFDDPTSFWRIWLYKVA
ncbi:hypothetical protein IC229_06015 [Spirosoma sp. BT702]|uniref:YfhO family protein n=1 Tax=Spirosoma profusum TaxID=2771354 RepID=A0A927AQE0_9BACT|nr:hypothetical protein [Spirosoma profusum]